MKGATNAPAPPTAPAPAPETAANRDFNAEGRAKFDQLINRAAQFAKPVFDKLAELNSYSHTNSGLGTDRLRIDFRPNKLDDFDVYTYHWKLFIVNLKDSFNGNVLNATNQTIIAESGVSDLTIDNVQLDGISTPSIESGTGTQTTIKFDITEPSGAGLLDKMFYEAVALGHGNWLVMPVYLQLEFKGRDPLTSDAPSNGAPGSLNGMKWVWPIKITDAKAKVSEVGAKYEFSAVKYNELAQSNAYFSIQHNIKLNNMSSFGQVMKTLEDKLNLDQYVKLIDNYSIPDVYRIVVDPRLENVPLILVDKNKQTMRASDYINFSDKTATFTAGTGIDKIIDTLLGNTEYYQTKLPANQTRNGQPLSTEQAPTLRKFWRIITESRPLAYDFMRQDNAVEITIFITEYDIGLVDNEAVQTAQKSDISKKRFRDYLNKGVLKKQYNYIFTGLNDQIINLDLTMNFSFAAVLSRFGGVYYESGIPDKGLVNNNDEIEQIRKLNKQVSETIRFVNDAGNDQKKSEEKIKEATESLNKSKLDEETKDRYRLLLEKSRPSTRQDFTSGVVQNQGITRPGQVDKGPLISKSLANFVEGTDLRFVSNVDINSTAAEEAIKRYEAAKKGKLRPIVFREGSQESALTGGMDTSNDSARSRVSSVFSTALYSTLDASLQNLKFTIKGDPFWLFPEPIPETQTKLRINAELVKTDKAGVFDYFRNLHLNYDSANQLGTDNFILVRFRTPRIYNELSGMNDPYTDVETFSGVYKVVTISSKFENGKFTQELNCILDPLIDIKDIRQFIKFIEASIRAQGLPATKVLDGQQITKTAVKTQRIEPSSFPKGESITTQLPKLPRLGG